MFFNFKKEESAAIALFRRNCTTHGLNLRLSAYALDNLRQIVEAKVRNKDSDFELNDAAANVLVRRGMIRYTQDVYVVTEVGLLTITLAEASGLVSIRGNAKAA